MCSHMIYCAWNEQKLCSNGFYLYFIVDNGEQKTDLMESITHFHQKRNIVYIIYYIIATIPFSNSKNYKANVT